MDLLVTIKQIEIILISHFNGLVTVWLYGLMIRNSRNVISARKHMINWNINYEIYVNTSEE